MEFIDQPEQPERPDHQMEFDIALNRQLSARQRQKDQKSRVERIFSRKQIEQAFLETFELVGGIPRLAIWANEPANYGKFLELMMKMAPKEMAGGLQATVLEYRSNIPSSPLNRPPPPAKGDNVIEDGVLVDEDFQ